MMPSENTLVIGNEGNKSVEEDFVYDKYLRVKADKDIQDTPLQHRLSILAAATKGLLVNDWTQLDCSRHHQLIPSAYDAHTLPVS
jgi:hypothetical protein